MRGLRGLGRRRDDVVINESELSEGVSTLS